MTIYTMKPMMTTIMITGPLPGGDSGGARE
jgi:hypothetical protein